MVSLVTKDIEVLEKVQTCMLSFIPTLGGLSYEAKLKETGLSSLLYRRERADMITVYRWINGKDKVDIGQFFDFYGESNRTTRLADYEKNIIPKRSRTEIRSNSFMVRVANK